MTVFLCHPVFRWCFISIFQPLENKRRNSWTTSATGPSRTKILVALISHYLMPTKPSPTLLSKLADVVPAEVPALLGARTTHRKKMVRVTARASIRSCRWRESSHSWKPFRGGSDAIREWCHLPAQCGLPWQRNSKQRYAASPRRSVKLLPLLFSHSRQMSCERPCPNVSQYFHRR